MVEQGIVLKRLALLEEYLSDLEEVKGKSWKEFSSDKVIRRYVERTLHVAVEACLDIVNHIISYEGFREPTSNKDSFQVLLEEGIIENDLAESLKKMAQFRNVIVHDYIKLQPEIIYGVLQKNLSDIVNFSKIVKHRYISTSN